MVNLLEAAQTAIDIGLYYGGAPDENYRIAVEEIRVGSIRAVVKFSCRHTVILYRLFETLLFKKVPDELVFEIHELMIETRAWQDNFLFPNKIFLCVLAKLLLIHSCWICCSS